MSTIAFCGLGMMGSAMATRLRSAGHVLQVWNRSRHKAEGWAKEGGTVCDSPRSSAINVDAAHLMLADDDAVDSTLFGSDGIASSLRPGAAIVDHSTVSVAGTKQRAVRIRNGGWRFLQAPVFVSPAQLAHGEGLMLIGGDAQTYEAIGTQLRQIVERQFVVGDRPEDAAAFKLMGNCMLVTVVEGLAEFFAIALSNGISPHHAMSLFKSFDPCGTIARRGPRIASGDYLPAAFELSMGLKDVQLMNEAVGNDALVPALKAIERKMQRLIDDRGYAKLDLAALGAEAIPPRGGEAHEFQRSRALTRE